MSAPTSRLPQVLTAATATVACAALATIPASAGSSPTVAGASIARGIDDRGRIVGLDGNPDAAPAAQRAAPVVRWRCRSASTRSGSP